MTSPLLAVVVDRLITLQAYEEAYRNHDVDPSPLNRCRMDKARRDWALALAIEERAVTR